MSPLVVLVSFVLLTVYRKMFNELAVIIASGFFFTNAAFMVLQAKSWFSHLPALSLDWC